MNKNQILKNAALSGLLTFAVTEMAQGAGGKNQEKCYGVAKAGQNDCGSKDGSHNCSGKAKKDYDKNEWKYVKKGTCEAAKAALKKTKK